MPPVLTSSGTAPRRVAALPDWRAQTPASVDVRGWVGGVGGGGWVLPGGEVDGFSADHGAQDLRGEDLARGGGGEVAVEDDEIGEEAGFEAALLELAELGESGALSVGVEGFVEGDALLGVEGLGASFVLAGDGGVEPAKGTDGFDRVVGAEGEGDVVVEHGAPRRTHTRSVRGRGAGRPRPYR